MGYTQYAIELITPKLFNQESRNTILASNPTKHLFDSVPENRLSQKGKGLRNRYIKEGRVNYKL